MNNSKKPTLQPETRKKLQDLIRREMEQHGNQCDLNHIDVSFFTDFSYLFESSKFNGNISKWNVSRAIYMDFMFEESEFNGDISMWDVSKVVDMHRMFKDSRFNGNISDWNTSRTAKMSFMFYGSNFNGDISKWDISGSVEMGLMFKNSAIAKKISTHDPSFEQVKSHFLSLRLETDLEGTSSKQNSPSKIRL